MVGGIKFSVDVGVYEQGRKRPEYTIDSDLSGEISFADFLSWTKAMIIVTADTVLREEQAMGFDQNPIVAVDGSVRKPVINVNPLGKIEITARASIKEIILETYDNILTKSPVLTGQYKSHNYVFLNGRQVATDMASLTSWINGDPELNDKDLIRFVNIEPYARKLERMGVTAQRTQVRSSKSKRGNKTFTRAMVPNGTYFLTARAIRAKYKRNSIIQFTFLSGAAMGLTATFKKSRGKKPSRPYLYPSIVISVQERGTL